MYDLNLNSSKTAQYISDNFVIDKTGDKEKDLIMCDEASFTKTIQKQDQQEYLFIPNDLVYARMAEVLMQDKELKRYLDYTKKTNVSMSQNAINNTKVYYSLDFAQDDLRFFSDINNGQMSYHEVLEDHIKKEGAEFAHILYLKAKKLIEKEENLNEENNLYLNMNFILTYQALLHI